MSEVVALAAEEQAGPLGNSEIDEKKKDGEDGKRLAEKLPGQPEDPEVDPFLPSKGVSGLRQSNRSISCTSSKIEAVGLSRFSSMSSVKSFIALTFKQVISRLHKPGGSFHGPEGPSQHENRSGVVRALGELLLRISPCCVVSVLCALGVGYILKVEILGVLPEATEGTTVSSLDLEAIHQGLPGYVLDALVPGQVVLRISAIMNGEFYLRGEGWPKPPEDPEVPFWLALVVRCMNSLVLLLPAVLVVSASPFREGKTFCWNVVEVMKKYKWYFCLIVLLLSVDVSILSVHIYKLTQGAQLLKLADDPGDSLVTFYRLQQAFLVFGYAISYLALRRSGFPSPFLGVTSFAVLLTFMSLVAQFLVFPLFSSMDGDPQRTLFRVICWPFVTEFFLSIARACLRFSPEGGIDKKAALSAIAVPLLGLSLVERFMLAQIRSPLWMVLCNLGLLVAECTRRLSMLARDKAIVKLLSRLRGWNVEDFLLDMFGASWSIQYRCLFLWMEVAAEYTNIFGACFFAYVLSIHDNVGGLSRHITLGSTLLNILIQVLMEISTDLICLSVEIRSFGLPVVKVWNRRSPNIFLAFFVISIVILPAVYMTSGLLFCATSLPNSTESFITIYC